MRRYRSIKCASKPSRRTGLTTAASWCRYADVCRHGRHAHHQPISKINNRALDFNSNDDKPAYLPSSVVCRNSTRASTWQRVKRYIDAAWRMTLQMRAIANNKTYNFARPIMEAIIIIDGVIIWNHLSSIQANVLYLRRSHLPRI